MNEGKKRKRVKTEHAKKAREAMLSAVQIFNSPLITFKSEIFITLAVIAWTYLLHEYYRSQNIDYRCLRKKNGKRQFIERNKETVKLWSLSECLKETQCPLDEGTKLNLKFLIEIRNEIEHQMTDKIDADLEPKLQACAINFDYYIGRLLGEKYRLSEQLSFAIQFSPLSAEQKDGLKNNPRIPSKIKNFISTFEKDLPDGILNSEHYAYRIHFVRVNSKSSSTADETITFLDGNCPEALDLANKTIVMKTIEQKKYLPSKIVKAMQDKGYKQFSMYRHTMLWKELDAKNPGKGFGTKIENAWYWYDRWLKAVENYCLEHAKELM